ncbi:unnamed protein product [Alopecurus aequalis]
MATEGSKKVDEQHSHDQRQHVGGGMDLDLASQHVNLDMMRDAILHKRHEAATGQRLADKVVGLFSAEEVKEREERRKKDEADGLEKNNGVYQF